MVDVDPPHRPLPVLPGVYQCRIRGRQQGFPVGTTVCFYDGTGAGVSSPAVVGATVAAAWQSKMYPQLSVDYFGDGVDVYNLTTSSASLVTSPMTGHADLAGQPLPPDKCMLISHNVGERRRQGHNYLGPVSTNVSTGNNAALDPTYMGVLLTAWEDFITMVTTDVLAWPSPPAVHVLISRTTAGAPDDRHIPVLSTVVRSRLADQNRRNTL